jgi:hypothetical protein
MCMLYLGAPSTYTATGYMVGANPAIDVGTVQFQENGGPYPISVTLQNHDVASGCSGSLVSLYWSDPTTSFTLEEAIPQSPATATQPIAAVPNTLPPTTTDTSTVFNFSWTPDAGAFGTNGGHVCLAAVAQCTSSDCPTAAPCGLGQTATLASPLVAIHNVQIYPPPPRPPLPPKFIHPHFPLPPFFFGATNGGNAAGLTRIVARAYDPDHEEDRVKILNLAWLPAVRRAYGRQMKFGVPAQVSLALGAESVISRPNGPRVRLGYTGPVQSDLGDELVKRSWVNAASAGHATKEVELVPRQIQQAGVQVTANHDDGRLYAIEISHELLLGGAPPALLGRLVVVYAAPIKLW